MKKKHLLIGILILVIAAVAYYAISPLFNNVHVDDALPTSFESGEEVYAMDGPYDVHETPTHPSSGTLSVYEGDGRRFMRFEDFETINGPQLHLYLAKDLDAKEYIDLGPIKGTEGNIIYELPEDVILGDYPYVLHWCVPFKVLFNYVYVGE